MRRTLFKSKIHRATLTGAHLDYEGSISVDRDLMDAAELVPYEKVQVLNLSNGVRLETYVIEGTRGSREIQLGHAPTVVHVDRHNRLLPDLRSGTAV
jgi:aspartate 1-decarboxylase